MSRKRIICAGESFARLAERFYDVYKEDGRLSNRERDTVIEELKRANPSLGDRLPVGRTVVLPDVSGIELLPAIHIDETFELRQHARSICTRINREDILGLLFLVDPARTLEELDFSFSDEARADVQRSAMGVSRLQSHQFDRIKAKGRVRGIGPVRLRPHGIRFGGPEQSGERGIEPATAPADNPIGGYDTSIDVSESIVEKIAKLAYDEGVIPHRRGPLVLGRPEFVSFDAKKADWVKVSIPFALVSGELPKQGKLIMEAGINAEEKAGKPAYIKIDFGKQPEITVTGTDLNAVEKKLIAELASKFLPELDIPLSPIIKQLDGIGLSLADLDFKVHNAPGPTSLDSLAICLNFTPNNNVGSIQKVKQFAKTHWAVGINERLIKQKFQKWWNDSPSAAKYKRMDKGALENFKDLAKKNKIDQIFNANGDIVVNSVGFSCETGYLSFSADVTAENQVLWIDVDAELTGDLYLAVNKNHKLMATVKNVDVDVSCLSKFLVGLFGAVLGLIGGGFIGAVVGGVVGGVVGTLFGVTVGATIGAFVSGIVAGAVLPALKEAALNDKLSPMEKLELIALKYDWQIPKTTITVAAAAEWISVVSGEVLLGGDVTLPSLKTSKVSITRKTMKSTKKQVVLPWSSKEQIAKLGGSPSYWVFSETRCSVQCDSAMEKPLSATWTFDGQKLDGIGDEILVTATPSLGLMAVPEPVGVGSTQTPGGPVIAKPKLVPAIQITKSIQVVKSDGTKGAPLVTTRMVAGPVSEYFDRRKVEVHATDPLGKTATAKLDLSIHVLGDALSDWWHKNKHKYEMSVPLEDLIGPDGLRDDLISRLGLPAWRSEVVKDMGQVVNIARADLAVNLDDAKEIEDTMIF